MSEKDNIVEQLEEILLWMKYDYLETRKKLREILDTPDKILVYELSNGDRSTREIAKYVSVTFRTIAQWWNRWFDAGLMAQTEKYGGSRYKRLCSLTKMGIKIPEKIEEPKEDE